MDRTGCPEPVKAPWLRIFARLFDYLLYALLLEPLFLCWFGATPGKLILGLYVTYDLAEYMPLEAARRRT